MSRILGYLFKWPKQFFFTLHLVYRHENTLQRHLPDIILCSSPLGISAALEIDEASASLKKKNLYFVLSSLVTQILYATFFLTSTVPNTLVIFSESFLI